MPPVPLCATPAWMTLLRIIGGAMRDMGGWGFWQRLMMTSQDGAHGQTGIGFWTRVVAEFNAAYPELVGMEHDPDGEGPDSMQPYDPEDYELYEGELVYLHWLMARRRWLNRIFQCEVCRPGRAAAALRARVARLSWHRLVALICALPHESQNRDGLPGLELSQPHALFVPIH